MTRAAAKEQNLDEAPGQEDDEMALEDQMDPVPAVTRRLSAAASELEPAAVSMMRLQRSMMTAAATEHPLEPLADDDKGKPDRQSMERSPEQEMAQQLRELRQMLEVQRQQMEALQQELRQKDREILSTKKRQIPAADEEPVSSVALSVQGLDFQDFPENEQKMLDRAPKDRSGREEARAQLAGWPDGELKPFMNERLSQFERFQIEGFIFDARECANGRQRRIDFKAASEVKDVTKFRTRDAERLELFLESVVRVINHWDVQPGDWGRILTYYLDQPVVRALRQDQPACTSFAAIVRYLRRTYPVGGAIEAARILEFRNTVQGEKSVTDFYETLCRYHESAPLEFTEREVTRQFVNNLHVNLRGEIRKEYDRDIRCARLLTLYQMALGVELRARQDRHPASGGTARQGSGSWYGKPHPKPVMAAVASSDGKVASWKVGSCFNCGSPQHQVSACQGKCDNCKQAGHTFKTCRKKCSKCGGDRHSQRWCQQKDQDGAAGQDRQEVPILAGIILVTATREPAHRGRHPRPPRPHRVLVTTMTFEGSAEPLRVGLDTLAAANVMSEGLAERLGILEARRASASRLEGVGRSTSQGLVTATLQVFPTASKEPATFELLPSLPEPIDVLLGLPWLEQHRADLRLRRHPRRTRVSLRPANLRDSDISDSDDDSAHGWGEPHPIDYDD